MNQRLLKALLSMLVVMALLIVTACGSNKTDNEAGGNDENGSSNEGAVETPADPMAKYDPAIEITTVRIVNDTYKYAEGESIDNNVWTKMYEDEMGIKIKYDWVVSGDGPGGQGEQKMNVTITSGDLPEFIPVNATQLKQLVDADLIMDLTDVYDKYATDLTKNIMTQDGPTALDSATFDGKLMAIPNTGSMMDGAPMIWLRQDWLEKYNLPEPKTMNDVFTIIETFAKNTEGGVGLAMFKDLFGGYAGLEGFFNGYHAYPNIWIKDESGNLVYGSIQPEVKEALAKLQELYKKGLIDREFGVKDSGKAAEAQGAGKNGFHFGQMWNPLYPLGSSYENDKAQWKAYPLVSVDGELARPQVTNATTQYFAVRKDVKHPEALVKMVNKFVEIGWGESTTLEDYAKYFTWDGLEKFKYAPFQSWPARKNLDTHLHVTEALKNNDPSKLNAEELNAYNFIQKHLAGEGGALEWGNERVFGEEGSFSVINKYVNEDMFMRNEFYGAPTPTMVERGSSLTKLELEVFTRIIMGESLDEFDKFVADWKKLGGEQITQEVNEWYQNK